MPVCPKCHRHLLKGMSVCTYCVKKTYVFGRAFTYFKPYMKKVVFAALLLTAANVLNAVLPLFNSLLLDNYLVPKDGATPYFSSKTTGIIVIAVSMAAVFMLSKLLGVLSARISNRVGSGFSSNLRLIVYDKIQALSLSSVSGRSAGNLIHRVTKDTERVKDFYRQTLRLRFLCSPLCRSGLYFCRAFTSPRVCAICASGGRTPVRPPFFTI